MPECSISIFKIDFSHRGTRQTPVLRLDPTLPEQLIPFLRLCHQTPPLYMTSPPLEKCSISMYKIESFYRTAWNADAVLRWEFCLSVRLSVCLSNACIVTRRKKNLSRFLYHAKDHLPSFLRRMVGGVSPSTCNFGTTAPPPVGAKSSILSR